MSPPLHHHHHHLAVSGVVSGDDGALNLKETELRLGLPGCRSPERGEAPAVGLALGLKGFVSGSKRGSNGEPRWGFDAEAALGSGGDVKEGEKEKKGIGSVAKAQVVGWPPIRNYRKNTMASNSSKSKDEVDGKQGVGCLFMKVSMDGAPYLRKVDLKTYNSYKELSSGLEKMFSCFTIGQCGSPGIPARDGLSETRLMDLLSGSEYVLTYEDKDGDCMLVGDVPWEMFTESCRRLRIMKGSDAIGLAPRVMEKCKNWNLDHY